MNIMMGTVLLYGMFEMNRFVGDGARCRNWENAIQHMKLGAPDAHECQPSGAPGFRVRIAFSQLGQRPQSPRGYSEQGGIPVRMLNSVHDFTVYI